MLKSLRNARFSSTRILTLFLVLLTLAGFINPRAARGQPAENVILLIGDGMGPEQVKAAEYFKGEPLFFQSWPHKAGVDTSSASSNITDSAAAGTAMATGRRVNNGVISLAIPGDSNKLCTVLEYFRDNGKRTGLVTTDAMTGATPAAFAAHESSRGGRAGIASNYLTQTRPNVLYGGGGGMKIADVSSAGYLVVTNRAGLLLLSPSTTTNVAGLFGKGQMPYEYDGVGSYPHLLEMARSAISVLEKGPAGFFLMIESGNIDRACHANDLPRMIPDVLEFERTVRAVADWADNRSNTLLIVTADHETGGLKVVKDNGAGMNPTVQWTDMKKGHTGIRVPLWARGINSDKIPAEIANTNIFQVMMQQ